MFWCFWLGKKEETTCCGGFDLVRRQRQCCIFGLVRRKRRCCIGFDLVRRKR